MNKKKIAAIDFGLKRIGIALSDLSQKIAFPYATVEGGVDGVVKALAKEPVSLIVVGLPLLLSGQKGEMALKVEVFARALEEKSQIPVQLLDERLSSRGADAKLRELSLARRERDERIDRASAALLLQTYLDSLNGP